MLFTRLSLACFLPKVFILISWLDASFHFVDIYLMLRDMFIDHDHLVFTLYTYHEPDTSFFVWSWIRSSTRCSYFHYRKVKDTFSYSHVFREIRLDHLIIFSLMELELKVESRIFWYRLSIDLVLVSSFTPHLFSSHLDHFLDHR